MNKENSLVIFTKASQMLAEANTIQKVKEFKDLAITATQWAKRKKMGEEAVLLAQSYAVEAERKLGQMLKESELARGGQPYKSSTGSLGLPVEKTPTLKDLGITKKESSEAQKIASLDDDVFDMTQDIKLSMKSAAKLADKPKSEQKDIISKIKSGEAKTVSHALAKKREESKVEQYKSKFIAPSVSHMSFNLWLDLQDKCDCILTDPPYITEFDDKTKYELFVKELIDECESKVKPTGCMYICISAYPDEINTYLNTHSTMSIQNILIWTYNNAIGAQSDEKYIQNYQCILFYTNKKFKLIGDSINNKLSSFTINAPDGRQGNRYHVWQKPDELAERLILNSTKKGDLILDPFVCTGTFVLAANKLGRIGKGCDVDKNNLELAVKRGCKFE